MGKMNKKALHCRAIVRRHNDGSFSVVARDLTTDQKVVLKQGIPPWNRAKAVSVATLYNKRILGEVRRYWLV